MGIFQPDIIVPVRHVRQDLTVVSLLLQRRRRTNIRAQVVVSFEEAARGAKRTIRVAQGVPAPKNVDIEIPAGAPVLNSNPDHSSWRLPAN